MKQDEMESIKKNSEDMSGCYKELYDIDKKIIEGGFDECSNCVERLLKLKGDVIANLCIWKQLGGGKFLKLIKNEVDDFLWNINIRIDTLKAMELPDGLNTDSFLEEYIKIYNSPKVSKVLDAFIDTIRFYFIAVLGILAVILLRYFNVIDESDGKYVVLLTYIYFLLGRTKKISLDGIRFWKPKNWKENIRN